VTKPHTPKTIRTPLAVVTTLAVDHALRVIDIEAVEAEASIYASVTELAVIRKRAIKTVATADSPVREVASFTEITPDRKIAILIGDAVIAIEGILNIGIMKIGSGDNALESSELLKERTGEIVLTTKVCRIHFIVIPP
jgi:hypothetical protein